MSSFRYVFAILAMMPMLGVPVLAQENSVEMPAQAAQPQVPPDFGNPRFAFHRIDGGFLRLDLVTGAVASCSQNAAGWTCIPGREERAALDREMARLQRDNAALKNALLEHGVPLPNALTLPSRVVGGGKDGAPAPAETVPRPPQTVPPGAWLLRSVPWTEARHVIRARGADDELVERLDVAPGTACLVLERHTWLLGALVTEVRLTYPGDRHEFVGRFSPVAA